MNQPNGKQAKGAGKGANGKEIKDYGYGEVTTTNYLTGDVSTRIFTGPMRKDGKPGNNHFDVKGRGAQG